MVGLEITSTPLSRADIVKLIGAPQHLVDCDLAEVDLSKLDLAGWTFARCNLRHADFTGANLANTTWQSCRAAFANFSAADFAAKCKENGLWIKCHKVALSELGIRSLVHGDLFFKLITYR